MCQQLQLLPFQIEGHRVKKKLADYLHEDKNMAVKRQGVENFVTRSVAFQDLVVSVLI